jgi:hypothetical protein
MEPEDRFFFAAIVLVLVIAIGGVFSILAVGVVTSNKLDDRPTLAETVNTFTPPEQPKPLDYSLQNARYLQFEDPLVTAKSMAKYLNGEPAFDDVFYGVVTPFEITLHGNLHGSRFDLRLSKVGPQRVLLKNCMMGSCYAQWAGARPGRELAQRSSGFHERFLLHQRVRAGLLRLGDGRATDPNGAPPLRSLNEPASSAMTPSASADE